tara:strand:+ start:5879 stop:6061 length:183 start_codon:yes stop_codon:yes gene_type:complete
MNDWKQILATGVAMFLIVAPISYCDMKSSAAKSAFKIACMDKGWAMDRWSGCVPTSGNGE